MENRDAFMTFIIFGIIAFLGGLLGIFYGLGKDNNLYVRAGIISAVIGFTLVTSMVVYFTKESIKFKKGKVLRKKLKCFKEK